MRDSTRLYPFRQLPCACRAVLAAEAQALDEPPARDVRARSIDETLGVGYGIFGGRPTAWARLRFTPERARWVEREVWHPQQETHTDPDCGKVALRGGGMYSGPLPRREWPYLPYFVRGSEGAF